MKISLSLPMDVTSSLPLLSLFLSKYPDSLSPSLSPFLSCVCMCDRMLACHDERCFC